MYGDIEELLEFDKIRAMIVRSCGSGLGKSMAEELKPLADIARIERMLDICAEAKEINVTGGGIPLRGLRDIRSPMKKAAVIGAMLEPEGLLDIASTARVARGLKTFAEETAEEYPIMAEIIAAVSTFPQLEEAINACIGPEGNILDSASSALAKIRRQLITARERLMSLLESMLHSAKYQSAIQENVITIRNDRYVIPVKQNLKNDVPGVVQARSASGVTIFVEPTGAVELNNQMRELEDQETREIRRILRELTDKVREALPSLETTVRTLAELDLINAKALFCINLGTTKPKLNANGYVEIAQAKHPLLILGDRADSAPEEVVPIDFRIGGDFNTLIITGPNTGGKTVALKTIGLLTLMMQAGLLVPVEEGSQMSTFKQIFADIGDEQSIEQNLSTFSSHMTRIINIVEHVDDSSLVLLDELGAGTEPSEGAALGMAILDFLHSSGAKNIATTHHDSLKAHAYSQEGMENASVAFNLESLKPTYELRIGVPGSSNALKIAHRLGLPQEIGENARNYLGSEALEVADLISNVEGMQRELEEQKRFAEEKSRSASEAQQSHERLFRQLKGKKRELEREALREASSIVQNARKLVENTITELRREKATPKSVQRARETLVKAKKEIAIAVEPEPRPEGREPASGELKIGAEVYVRSLRRRGTLISLPDAKGLLQIRAGGARINVPVSAIRLPANAVDSDVKQKNSSANSLQSAKKSRVLSSLDLRGHRAEEALDKTDKYLDDAALAGLEFVSIVHGKGTGALRAVVTDLLSDHPHVASFRPGEENEGGLGVTMVELAE